MAKLADALDLGSSSLTGVWVQVPPLAPKKGKYMKEAIPNRDFAFSSAQILPNTCLLKLTVPQALVDKFFIFAAQAQKEHVAPPGFKLGQAPLEYILTHYKKNITNHFQEIALKHFVMHTLLQKIREHKILLIGQPRLIDIKVDRNQDAIYVFEGTVPQEVYIQSWKNLPFKATVRKRYRDIDNQVKYFLEAEEILENEYRGENGIAVGDWICFDTWLVDKQDRPVFDTLQSNLWLKIGDEEPDLNFQEIFLGKHKGDRFSTNNANIQNHFCDLYNSEYDYAIEIKDILPFHYFSVEYFKHHFKLKSKKDLHNKFIEVFSFNSDISQRRSIADSALSIIVNKNIIRAPIHCIEEQRDILVSALQHKADYTVYKMHANFINQMYSLAKKQISEIIAVDHIAYQENLQIGHDDVKALLNLMQRARTKDFLYFNHPSTRINGQEVPMHTEILKRAALREKALNHIIFHLTQQ